VKALEAKGIRAFLRIHLCALSEPFMPSYGDIASRNEMAAELPQAVQDQIIGEIERESTLLSLGHEVPVLAADSKVPVLVETPDAFWLDGDTGLKGTSKVAFQHQNLTIAELAVIVPVADAHIEDASVPIFDVVKRGVATAMARRIDAAALFGIDKPTGMGPSLLETALAADHVVAETDDPVADLLAAAEVVANDEYTPTGACVRTGWEWGAARSRVEAFHGGPVGENAPFRWAVGGLPIKTQPCYWDRTAAIGMVAAWNLALYGIRRRLTFEFFKTGVLTDAEGNITVNLLQNDVTALRCTMRLGFLLAKPVTANGTIGDPVSIVSAGSTQS
jgi:hypothetical protein